MIYSVNVSHITQWIKIVIELSKIRISQLVAMSTLLGYILATGELSLFMLVPTLGTFLLSCGSAALNQYQERDYDRLMERTRSRPISSGRITPEEGLLISSLLILAGSLVLFVGTNPAALFLGWLNILWYNGIYTPLKRKTPFAVIPGSVIGAIPPAIGWAAAGRSLLDPQILAIAFFFFIWQIPHFWLLILVLDKDYQQAGFPTLTQLFSRDQLSRITFIWIISTAVTGFLITLFGIVSEFWISMALFTSSLWLTWKAFKLLADHEDLSVFRLTFSYINYFALFVVFLVSIDRLF